MSALQRPRYPVPSDVERALAERGRMEAYQSRPDYRQNDYISWIERARRDDTRRKRVEQMLDELQAGDAYMGMAYHARHPGDGSESRAAQGHSEIGS